MTTLRLSAVLAIVAFAGCSSDTAKPVPLNLLSAGATQAIVQDEQATFTTQSGITVDATYGAVGALRDMVIAGTPADVMIVTPAIITTLDGDHLVQANSRTDLGVIGGGLAVKAGAAMPDISTDAALMTLVDQLGIGDEVRAKGHTASGGAEAMQAMAASMAANPVGATQVSEILSVPQVTLVGEYPSDLQVDTTYSAIIVEGTKQADEAQQLVQFFVGADFQARLAKSGFKPAPK